MSRLFRCLLVRRVAVLDLRGTSGNYEGYSMEDLQRFRVDKDAVCTELQEAMASLCAEDYLEPMIWVHLPAREISFVRGSSRCGSPCWEGVPGALDPPASDEDSDSDSVTGDDSDSDNTPYNLVPCHSFSLAHPAAPYDFSGRLDKHGETNHVLPNILGGYEVHLFLKPKTQGRRPTLCILRGHEGSSPCRWERAVESLVLPGAVRDCHYYHGDVDSDDWDSDYDFIS